ncbi:MAG: hypothetical protein KAS90_04320, partial [Candidatus Aenigmarchaeota archaeon]|nr:hypothetical protein [Candidatus Aenigmarchaeota archaeon]
MSDSIKLYLLEIEPIILSFIGDFPFLDVLDLYEYTTYSTIPAKMINNNPEPVFFVANAVGAAIKLVSVSFCTVLENV